LYRLPPGQPVCNVDKVPRFSFFKDKKNLIDFRQ